MKLAEGTGIAIDYIDTFRLLGHDYVESLDPVPPTWDPNRPGTPAGHIICTLDTYQVDPSYVLHDGNATFIPVGTPIYLVTTSKGTTEAVVKAGGQWKTYKPLPSP